MSWIITFNIIGDNFDPSGIDINFNQKNKSYEIDTSGTFQGKPFGYGSATYVLPKSVPRLEKFKFLADLFEPKLNELKENGAENWWIEIGRLYAHQCNEELDVEELKEITRLKCSVTYSAYSVSEEDEKKGFDYTNYCNQNEI
jgi:hypothetical protein